MIEQIINLYEGVDTISIKITNDFINYKVMQNLYFSRVQQINQISYIHNICKGLSISRTDSLIKNSGSILHHYYLNIQAEFIYMFLLYDPRVYSCYQVVFKALQILLKKEIIRIPDYYHIPEQYKNRSNLADFRLIFHLSKICKLTELDFFFDFDSWDNIKPFVTAKKIGKTTFYSTDHGDFKSQIIIYDRHERLKAVNQLSYEEIKKIKPVRLEFRLNIKTCNYLDVKLLYGNFYELFFRYAPILIKSWKKYAIAYVKKDLVHPLFDFIQTASECGQVPKIGNELKKTS